MPRHLMQPDPDAPPLDPVAALWLIVAVLAGIVIVAMAVGQ